MDKLRKEHLGEIAKALGIEVTQIKKIQLEFSKSSDNKDLLEVRGETTEQLTFCWCKDGSGDWGPHCCK